MSNLIRVIKERGITYTIKKIILRLKGNKIDAINEIRSLFSNKVGIEIGGPSKIFTKNGYVPIYDILKSLDGCNFSNATLWEGKIDTSLPYQYFEDKKGTQYISEATDLAQIDNENYDFVISSHCLEHVANPMKAINEWLRVIKKNGLLLIILPYKSYCFDHKRPFTEYAHLLEDYNSGITEKDLTHLEEILEFHDLNMDKPAGTLQEFKARSLNNYENRALHHHVFELETLVQLFQFFKLEIILTHQDENLIILGRK